MNDAEATLREAGCVFHQGACDTFWWAPPGSGPDSQGALAKGANEWLAYAAAKAREAREEAAHEYEAAAARLGVMARTREELAVQQAREDMRKSIRTLRAAIYGLLGSSDASWETNREGHDWHEACETARHAARAFPLAPGDGGEEKASQSAMEPLADPSEDTESR